MKSDPVEAVIDAMEKHEPTKAAMRAARVMFPELGEYYLTHRARIIDCATALPELLEACKAVMEIDHVIAPSKSHQKWVETWPKVKAAITKAEGQ